MEFLLIAVLPVLLMLTALSFIAFGQVVGFLQSVRSRARERSSSLALAAVLGRIAKARSDVAVKNRRLEELTRHLRLSNEELARLNDLKSKFLSMAVHDLRTPLSAVRGFTELLNRKSALGPGEKRYLDYVLKATDQMGGLISDLTDLAVIEAGRLNLRKEPFDVPAFMADLAPTINFVASGKGVRFSVAEVPSGAVLTGDRARLARVLNNLLGNAVKFTPPGGSVELRGRLVGAQVLFSVKDTGPGIHPSERRRVFEKFYQSRFGRDLKARAAGWGLGLAIADEIVRGHGGTIGVDSAGLGRGSTFWVRVPLRPRLAGALARAKVAVASLAAALALSAGAAAQTIPLEEKARFEHTMEERVESVLIRILGPNRSKVVVDCDLDFTRIEKMDIRAGETTVKTLRKGSYLWAEQEDGGKAPPEELLPGMPTPDLKPMGAVGPQTYERRNSYPEKFLRRMSVTLILDRSVPEAQSEEIRRILSELLEISAARGDALTVVRTAFVPVWKTVWQSPETAGMLIKYLLVSCLALVAVLVIALSFHKLAEAMSDMARSQNQQIGMDLRGSEAGGPGGEPGVPALPEPGSAKEEPAQPGEGEIVFDVKPEQVGRLVEMVRKEEAANVAVIAAHLTPEVRAAFLSDLPPERADEVITHLGRVRFLEPEMLLQLKEELTTRLSGAVGGADQVVEIIKAAPMDRRRTMIESLTARDPELAAQVRPRVFLIDDLAQLAEEEWARLHARVGFSEWAPALHGAPQAVLDAVQRSLPERSWRVLEQMIAASGGGQARAQALERAAAVLADLVAEGAIVQPASRQDRGTVALVEDGKA